LQGSNVLVVDDLPENLKLLSKVLASDRLEPKLFPGGKQALEAALADPPDIVLLDMNMPEMSGLEVCQRFKQDERLKKIPIIFISGLNDTETKLEAFRAGCVDYISKPFQKEEVLARVRTHLHLNQLRAQMESHARDLEQRVAEEVQSVTATQLATIYAMAKLAEVRDDDTGKHIERVQTFAKMLAGQLKSMGLHLSRLSAEFIDTLYQTASLHDIGKVGIPDAILLKPGKLTAEEFTIMKTHSAFGANTLNAVLARHPGNRFLRMGVDVARSHHEKWDGSGYPDGLAGAAIPLSGRITALADFYDALRSKRCYHEPFTHENTRRMIREGRGTHFDPDVVDAFMALEAEFERVRDEMGEIGEKTSISITCGIKNF
jgi:putative two-component system response regulator